MGIHIIWSFIGGRLEMFGREFVGIRLYISVERLGIMPFCVLLLKKMFTRNESQWAMIPYKVFDLLVSRDRSQVNFNAFGRRRIRRLAYQIQGTVPPALLQTSFGQHLFEQFFSHLLKVDGIAEISWEYSPLFRTLQIAHMIESRLTKCATEAVSLVDVRRTPAYFHATSIRLSKYPPNFITRLRIQYGNNNRNYKY